MTLTLAEVKAGDRVTILIPNGIGRNGIEYKPKSGRAVMPASCGGWVLDMGGAYGTPGVATEKNFVSARKSL